MSEKEDFGLRWKETYGYVRIDDLARTLHEEAAIDLN